MKPAFIHEDAQLEDIEPIDGDWWWHRDSGLRMRSLHLKTKLKKEWHHWVFEVTNGQFSVFLCFERWPTFYPVIRQGLTVLTSFSLLVMSGLGIGMRWRGLKKLQSLR